MKTIEINLYSFDELSKDVQKKVLEKLHDINVNDLSNWYEYIYSDYKDLLESYGFISPEIFFSGFWSQGDGACFDCEHFDLLKFAEKSKLTIRPMIKKLIESGEIDFSGKTYKNSYATYYYHYNTRFFEFFQNMSLPDNVWDYICSFENQVEAKREELSKDIYRSLYQEYESLTTDEAIIETIEANEYTFESNGKLRNF